MEYDQLYLKWASKPLHHLLFVVEHIFFSRQQLAPCVYVWERKSEWEREKSGKEKEREIFVIHVRRRWKWEVCVWIDSRKNERWEAVETFQADCFFLAVDEDDDEWSLLVCDDFWFWVCLVTVDTPSTNFVLNRILALLNIPSFRETTMNWGEREREKVKTVSATKTSLSKHFPKDNYSWVGGGGPILGPFQCGRIS